MKKADSSILLAILIRLTEKIQRSCLSEGNQLLRICSTVVDSLQEQISSQNVELLAVTSSHSIPVSSHNCLWSDIHSFQTQNFQPPSFLSSSCLAIPTIWFSKQSTSSSLSCPASLYLLLASSCSPTCTICPYSITWLLYFWILSRASAFSHVIGVPHNNLERPHVLHLYQFSDHGIKISQWVCL